jgi:uncharacterized protein (DUF2141 family)
VKSLKHALFLSLVFLLFAAASGAQSNSATTITLHVKTVRNSTGVVRFAIFASDNGWPDDKTKAIRYGSLPANGGTVTFTVPDLPSGTYAIAVFHDENENHKVDRDLFGRPREGIGFANNPPIHFSAPTWKQSSIQIAGRSVETTINLRYP